MTEQLSYTYKLELRALSKVHGIELDLGFGWFVIEISTCRCVKEVCGIRLWRLVTDLELVPSGE